MLPKKHRFPFEQKVPQKGVSTPFFVCKYQKNDCGYIRCGVIVSKKVDKRAVIRNNIKRTLLQTIQAVVPLDKPYDIILFARKPSARVNRTEMQRALEQILLKEGIIESHV